MSFFLGIYDSDTIDRAFGRRSRKTAYDSHSLRAVSEANVQLKQDWADLVGKFSWRVQPSDPAKAFGIL